MKNLLLTLLIIFLSFHCVAQITYQKGYFINKSGDRIECLIKNSDSKSNPIEFQYKLNEFSDSKSISIEDVNEFEIYEKSKFLKRIVNIDRSSDEISKLSDEKDPEFEQRQIFLRVLVEGKPTLYEYVEGNKLRFFYGYENEDIQQLVYKRYKTNSISVATNSYYKKQLWDILRCEEKPIANIQEADYKRGDLVKLFITYNDCSNSEYVEFERNQNKILVQFNIRPGISSSSLSILREAQSFKNVDFGTKLSFRFGAEVEFVLPFNSNKWTVICEPAYFRYKADKKINTIAEGAKVDFRSFEIPVGIRHYFYLNDESSLFVNGSIVFNLSSSDIEYENADDLTIQQSNSFAFGMGYKYKRCSLEFRNALKRTVVPHFDSSLGIMSLIFGYTIF